MTDIKFKKTELEDQELISYYFKHHTSRSCERTFVNCYLWSRYYHVEYAIIEDTLVFKNEDKGLAFTFPAGSEENVKQAISLLMNMAEERGCPFTMYVVTPDQFEKLEEWYPNKFEISYDEDMADYVYESEKLSSLTGKKLHAKRNHINKFTGVYEGRWQYETITDENTPDCFAMLEKWSVENECDRDSAKKAEVCITKEALRLRDQLNLQGGLIRLDGEVIAFSLGEPISSDTFVVHIEKAFSDIQGAYAMINQQFVRHECMDYRYVNREEDTGSEGLRKAKRSYRPIFMVEKGTVTMIHS